MRARFIPLAIAAILLALAAAGPVEAQVIARFEVRETVISPDGDGKFDSTRVRYTLADTVLVASLVVFEADAVTPVDTLRSPAPELPGGLRDFYWKGVRANGTPAPEGAYVVTLSVTPESGPVVTRSLPLFIDVTSPQVQILSVVPDPYAPGVPTAPTAVSISFVVADASPVYLGRPPDELKSAFTNPTGVSVTPSVLSTLPPFAGASGAYVMSWDATSEVSTLSDGEYAVTLSLVDAAGYAAASTYHFSIDVAEPHVKVTSLAENGSFQTPPDSLRGWAFDLQGVDTLSFRYSAALSYGPVPSWRASSDTLYFAVPLADSVSVEGPYTVGFRAVDGVGRVTSYPFSFRFDTTAPTAPTLTPFNGSWHHDSYRVTGKAEPGGDLGAFVRLLRNGVQVDSVSTVLSSSFAVNVPLARGRNEIVAVLRDGALNASPPSNTVVVTFDGASGLFAPAPFTPGASFAINAAGAARGVTLRVFDLTGDLVTMLVDSSEKQFYSLRWDGRNSSSLPTRKGPLVAVAVVIRADGANETLREVFLYDPDGP